jgi:hypothetical protein
MEQVSLLGGVSGATVVNNTGYRVACDDKSVEIDYLQSPAGAHTPER